MLLDSAESLFIEAKARVYSDESSKSVVTPEITPKWSVLSEIVNEIQKNHKASKDEPMPKVLVMAQDERACLQIRDHLCHGSITTLRRLYNKTIAVKSGEPVPDEYLGYNKPKKQATSEPVLNKDDITLTQINKRYEGKSEVTSDDDDDDDEFPLLRTPLTLIHPLY